LIKKYLFGLIVAAYVVSVVGIPVYKHYCGGELEKVNYVIKTNSCCCGEEENESNSGCCKDENIIVKNTPDFTIKKLAHFDTTEISSDLFFVTLPFLKGTFLQKAFETLNFLAFPPPWLQISGIISTSVLRI